VRETLLDRIERWPTVLRIMLVLALIGVVGVLDYMTGRDVLMSIFYLAVVAIAAWTVGRGFAACASVLAVASWLVGDFANGARYAHPLVPVWNASITLAFYLILGFLLASLHDVQRDLEARVRQRTIALTEEMAERERLEREILEIGERERRRIGHDLHDSLGQHLTATALDCQVLKEKLGARDLPESADASRIVGLIREAIDLTRILSHGLDPVEVHGGLAESLRELARRTSEHSGARCEFEADTVHALEGGEAATQMYRIAQEAVQNALKHGNARRIVLRLENGASDALRLTVQDDGVGISESHRGDGMGLGIMAHRAEMIGGSFTVGRRIEGGTIVTCEWPLA